jgi:putative hydrolase
VIDLHTHSLFSDGELLPSELARRAEVLGYRAVAITDHADTSNIDFIICRITKVCQEINARSKIRVIPGIEITHVPLDLIGPLSEEARKLGANIVVIHGETIVEPVSPGTNQAALLSPIDILAHPGLITEEDTILARERRILLEITTRKGHSLTNGHVARMAKMHGAKLILNTDAHAPEDLMDKDSARKVALGAGLTYQDHLEMLLNAEELVKKCGFLK